MMNNVNKYLIILSFFFLGCSNKEDESYPRPIEQMAFQMSYARIYPHPIGLGAKNEIIDGETIEMTLGDTIRLYITPDKEEEDYVPKVQHQSKLESIQISPVEYQCTTIETGSTTVLVSIGNNSQTHYFFADIASFEKKYLAVEAPSYIVDTDNEGLNLKILKEIEEYKEVFYRKTILLRYNTMQTGEIEFKSAVSQDIDFGTFSIIKNEITLNYKGAAYIFNVTESEPYSLICISNLTEEYQELYPQNSINQVEVTIEIREIGI